MTSVGWTGYPAWEETALDLVHEHSGGIPRRINRLCARVLLAGTLEHATVLTADLVSVTAEELTQDLGAICASAPPVGGGRRGGRATLRALTERVGQLERGAVPRERMGRLQKRGLSRPLGSRA